MEKLDLNHALAAKQSGEEDTDFETTEMYWIVGQLPETSRYICCTTNSHALSIWDLYERRCARIIETGNISYPLFADADTIIYPHAASQCHAWPKAKRGIAMLSVDKLPYPRQQTGGNEFVPCSNNICDILKRFPSFKIQLSY